MLEMDSIYRTEIPDSFSYITSGLLGERKPKSLFVFPLMADEIVYGAIEISSLDDIGKLHRDYLMELSNIIARTRILASMIGTPERQAYPLLRNKTST